MQKRIFVASLSILLLLLTSNTLVAQVAEDEQAAQTAQDAELKWLSNFEEAKKLAAAENKRILMSFSGSDWCANCMRLDRSLFQSAAFADYAAKNLVLLQLDFPSKRKNAQSDEQKAHNEKLAEKYNSKGSFPTVLLLSESGAQLGKMTYPAKSVEGYLSELTTLAKSGTN